MDIKPPADKDTKSAATGDAGIWRDDVRPAMLNCRGQVLSLAEPQVMGVLNVTPDSFYAGGRYKAQSAVLAAAEKMLKAGAAILDVGGVSTRPGARPVDEKTERQRVIPVIKALYRHFPEALLSVDTYRSAIAQEAVAQGAAIINDVSAGRMDKDMFDTVAALQVPYVMMHMQGTPENMQDKPVYKDVVIDIMDFMLERIEQLRARGVYDIVLDPGFGFGKTVSHNYRLLRELHLFQKIGCPLLAGVSRKSMINKVLDIGPEDALNGTTAVHVLTLLHGAHILRVHDVQAAIETIKIVKQYRQSV